MCCKQTQMTDALLEEEAELCVRQTDSDDRRALRKLNSVCCKQTQMTDALLEEEAELFVLQTDSDDRRAP